MMMAMTKQMALAALLLALASNVAYAQDRETSSGSIRCGADSVADDPIDVWRVPASALHGMQEFDRSVQIVFPSSVSSIVVELWGGGGGGGRGSDDSYSEGGAGGGGGASGTYSRVTVPATPDMKYVLVVGRGGQEGEPGGASAVCAGDAVLATAPGGSGGETARTNSRGGAGGKGGAVQRSNAEMSPGSNRAGNDGADGSAPLFQYRGLGGSGGRPVVGTIAPKGAFGGAGGGGAMTPQSAGSGVPGGPGSAIVSW